MTDNDDWSPETEARLFHEGVELFNEGEWFDAHEVWEDVWNMASGPKKLFYQGLIQCAVTLEHVRRGNPRGVLTVFDSAKSKFTTLPATYMGVRITELLSAIDRFIDPVRKLPREMLLPSAGRGLELPIDLAAAPKIELKEDKEER
ncbi:MAG: DUF309 domain-containing protein [Planctomycetes bacterium]|nr:DUF309 domain-containing protein [Planctomycetota bacterium]